MACRPIIPFPISGRGFDSRLTSVSRCKRGGFDGREGACGEVRGPRAPRLRMAHRPGENGLMSRKKLAGLAFVAVLVVAATAYVFTAPYARIAGVRIGGRMTPPPAD